MLPPRTIIQRVGISMTEDEAYKVHIQYTFNAFCKVVIRHAAIDKNLEAAPEVGTGSFP